MSETATAVLEAPTVTELALIDLSSIAYPIFLMSAAEPDPNAASIKIVARIRELTAGHPHAAICCDSGKSFRAAIDPTYKAQREAAPAALFHQIALAKEQLGDDGYPVWAVKGFEADDLIASATAKALAIEGASVLLLSADKDLLQLIGPRVHAKSLRDGSIIDAAAVEAKFGVLPNQMRDYLALVGDASDNVKGAKGIGKVKAKELLRMYGDLDSLYRAIAAHPDTFGKAVAAALFDFADRRKAVCELITLRTDAPIPFEEIAAERAPRHAALTEDEMQTIEIPQPTAEQNSQGVTVSVDAAQGSATGAQGNATATVASASLQTSDAQPAKSAKPAAMEIAGPVPAGLAPLSFERQLEPQSLGQAAQLANHMHAARMFNGYGTPQAVLSTVLAGRELGLQAIASLRAFHVIEGKHALAADAMRGLVLRAGVAQYFRCIERTPEIATFETWRKGDPEPIRLSYTVAEGRAAFVGDEAKWGKSSWGKHPADMLAARASSKLARLVYADILFGLYAPEELTEGAA